MYRLRTVFCRVTVLSLSCVAMLAVVGCQDSTQQGTLYSVTIGRELETYLPHNIKAVHQVTLIALTDHYGYTLDSEAVDLREGSVTVKTALDHTVRVKMLKNAQRVTRIRVYVGPSGNEAHAREILSRIESDLETATVTSK